MSYRPYYTNTQIDGQALNGAISGIGSLFGKGKTTATQGVDASGKPTLNYSTSGGDFWDRINGRRAEMGNLNAAGAGFQADRGLYDSQQGLNQKLAFNRDERLNSATDAETIFRNNADNIQQGLNDPRPAMQARYFEMQNKLADIMDQKKLFDIGLNFDKLSNMARIPGAQLASMEANTRGQQLTNEQLPAEIQARIALNNAHSQYYNTPRSGSSGLQFQPNAKGGGMVFDANSGEVTFVDPEMVTQYGFEYKNPDTGATLQGNPTQVPTGKRSVNKVQTGVTRSGIINKGLGGSPIPAAGTNTISGDKVSRALRILRGEE